MTILCVVGEDHDATAIGACTVDTATTAARNTTRARCSLKILSTSGTDGWFANFKQSSSAFWVTARLYADTSGSASSNIETITLYDGGTKRLYLSVSSGTFGATAYWQIVKRNAAGTNTTLATSSTLVTGSTLQKVDIYVNYAVSGAVKVYLDGSEIINYSGDVTTDGATSLSEIKLGMVDTSTSTYWSECIVNTNDTRSLNLVTLPPAANGNTFQWSNSYASVDETTINDADLCATANANDVMQTTITSSGITGTPGVHAVIVSGRAQKGGTGPTKIQMNVRTSSTDYFTADINLDTALGNVSGIWETNPNTSAAWDYTALTAAGFNIGAKAIA